MLYVRTDKTNFIMWANWLQVLKSPKLSTLKCHCPFLLTNAVFHSPFHRSPSANSPHCKLHELKYRQPFKVLRDQPVDLRQGELILLDKFICLAVVNTNSNDAVTLAYQWNTTVMQPAQRHCDGACSRRVHQCGVAVS